MVTTLAWINVGVGALVIALSLPLLLGKIPRNRYYGARFKASYASDENWYRINKASAIYLMTWAAMLVLLNLGVLLTTTPTTQANWLVMLIAFSPLLLLIAAGQTWAYARRLSL